MNIESPKSFEEHNLSVSKLHTLKIKEFGNPNGIPVMYIHGGPGGSSKEKHLNNFNLKRDRVILFDQRGCGQSTPFGEIKENTTNDLIEDIEKIRNHLAIEKWFVAGGSWGATLSLLYSQKYSDQVRGLFLKSFALLDQSSNNHWLFGNLGVENIYPELAEYRKAVLSKFGIPSTDNLEQIYKQLFIAIESNNLEDQKYSTVLINNYEGNMLNVNTELNWQSIDSVTEEQITSAKIFYHYASNHFFLEENEIINKIKDSKFDFSTFMVHGRYDLIAPVIDAFKIKQLLPDSELIISENSGHKFSAEGRQIVKLAIDKLLTQ